tara:strand:+ start:107 stop:238 length:132 start_codon:yes stop_codon:yes gene_type:complete
MATNEQNYLNINGYRKELYATNEWHQIIQMKAAVTDYFFMNRH